MRRSDAIRCNPNKQVLSFSKPPSTCCLDVLSNIGGLQKSSTPLAVRKCWFSCVNTASQWKQMRKACPRIENSLLKNMRVDWIIRERSVLFYWKKFIFWGKKFDSRVKSSPTHDRRTQSKWIRLPIHVIRRWEQCLSLPSVRYEPIRWCPSEFMLRNARHRPACTGCQNRPATPGCHSALTWPIGLNFFFQMLN